MPRAVKAPPPLTGPDAHLGAIAADPSAAVPGAPGQPPLTPDQMAAQATSANLNNILSGLFAANAPEFQAFQNQLSSLTQQMDQAGALYNQQAGYTNIESALQQQLLGLQGQGLMYQQAALNRQSPLLKQMYGLEQQGFGLQAHELALQRASEADQFRANKDKLASQQAATGGLFTRGAREDWHQLGVAHSQALDREAMAQKSLGITEKKAALTYNEQVAKLKDEQHNLDIAAKTLGVDKQLLQVKTQEALVKLGLDRIMTTDDIFRAIQDVNIQESQAKQGLVSTVLGMANMPGVAVGSVTGNQSAGAQGAANFTGGQVPASPSQQAYINQVLPYARAESARTGIPVSVMLAQSGVETGWGTSQWWTKHLNPAGIGVTGAPGAGYSYPSIQAAFTDYANRLMGHGEAGQGTFVHDVQAHASPVQLLIDLQNSPWAGGHYGYHTLVDVYNQLNLAKYG